MIRTGPAPAHTVGVHLEGRVSASDVLPEFAGWDARLAAIGAIRLASN